MLKYTITSIIEKINPQNIKISRKSIENIQDTFCENFEKTFTARINTKGYETYSSLFGEIFHDIFTEEIKGLVSGEKKITADYYQKFNERIAFAFHNHLDLDHGDNKGNHRYGGYSVQQIVFEIRKAAMELDENGTGNYRLPALTERIVGIINYRFAIYRENLRQKFIASVAGYPYGTLDPAKNYGHLDSILRMNASAQRICGMTYKQNSKYMSFPVAVDRHITDDPLHNLNIRAFLAALMSGYRQSGGYSVLMSAGTGTGKTNAYIKSFAPVLGEACNCEVYITMPTTPQLGQAAQIYGCDVRYSEGEIKDKGHNPNIRAYVYECVDSIPATTDDPVTGAKRPNILIIDEAHSLLTEKYRGKALRMITEKAKDFLSAGGIVVAISASVEMISATMPYNQLSGYDLICNVFRVSNRNALSEKLPYPNYSYADCVCLGKKAGVEIVNAIPADNIEVFYQNEKDINMSSTLASLILKKLEKGEKIVAEYNKIDQLTETKHFLEKKGYAVTVCSSMDKDSVRDEESRQNIYNNKVYNDVINNNAINFGETDVVLTTKLLENGTTINHILIDGKSESEIEEIQKKITTIFVVEKRCQLNLEAFEQFSGRIRFRHNNAVLLTTTPMTSEGKKYNPDMAFFVKKGMARIGSLSEKLRNNLIELSRLHYIDFNSIEDLPEGMDGTGNIDAQTISEAVYRAVNDYYKSIMYNKTLFENVVKNRYSTKNVTFTVCEEATAEIEELHKVITEEGAKRIREGVSKAANDEETRQAYISGYDKSSDKNVRNSLPGIKEMGENSRASYAKNAKTIFAVTFALQDIEEISNNLKTIDGHKPEKVLPEKLKKDVFETTFSDAAEADTKRSINSLMDEGLAAGFRFLSQYKGLSEVLKNYALRYGDSSYDNGIDELISECESRLPKMNSDLKDKIVALMRTLFTSDKKKRIDRLIYTCKYISNVDMEFFAEMAAKNLSELDQITLIYENATYALNPSLIHAEDTASGATFAILTSAEVFSAVTGLDVSEYKGLSSWKGKRITKARATVAYLVYVTEMQKRGFRYDSSAVTGALKILRLFASAFTFTQEISKKDGTVRIILGDVRKKRPMDYDQISHLNFKKKIQSKPNSFLMRFENESEDHLDDCRDVIIQKPFPIRCADTRDSMTQKVRKRHWWVPLFVTTNGKGHREYKIIGISESTADGRPILNGEKEVPIKYLNGFSDESDYSTADVIGFAVLNEAQYEEFGCYKEPVVEVLYRILKYMD